MSQVRDPNAVLGQSEVEAIKVNQDIIKRMADNSQKIKNIFLVACAAVVTLGGIGLVFSNLKVACLVALVIVFWVMDAKYLQLERQFRKHHKGIVDGSLGFLEMWQFNPMKQPKDCLFKIMFSFSLLIYPSVMLVALVLFL